MGTKKAPPVFRNRHNPTVVVTLLAESEYRVGEIKFPTIIYERNGKLYVRGEAEFHDKFQRVVD